MDYNNMLNELMNAGQDYLPNLLAALGVLIVGWVVALIMSKVARGILNRTSLDDRVAEWLFGRERAKDLEIAAGGSRLVFYIVMLFVLVAFFQILGLTMVTEPFNSLLNKVFAFIPQLLGAGILLLVAWGVASILRLLATKALETAGLDQRLSSGEEAMPATKSIGEAIYWLVFLVFLPAILGALSLQGLLQPVQSMMDKILGFLPNLLTGAVILVIGWLVARFVQRIVTSLLTALGLDALADRLGMGNLLDKTKLSGIVGTIAYGLILIPIVISALNALQLDSVTGPASAMLDQLLGALPFIFAAVLVLVFSYIVGRLVSGIVANLLSGVGFDRIFPALGLKDSFGEKKRTPSDLAGVLVMVAILFFAAVEAADLLGFGFLSSLLAVFVVYAGDVLLGLVVLALGLYLANLAASAVRASGVQHANFLGTLAYLAVLFFAGSIGLSQMGLAEEIVQLAFAVLLGSLGVAAAIAFGLGGRDSAAQLLEEWRQNKSG